LPHGLHLAQDREYSYRDLPISQQINGLRTDSI
jgi:hypothetical protein